MPNGGLKIGYFGPFSQFFLLIFAVFVAKLPKVTLKESLFSLHISYIVIQLLMMQLRYTSLPLVPNGDIKIGYFEPFS